MTGYDEAVAWFRADPERVRDLDDVDNRSAAITIVNAVLAGAVPAGRDLTAQDVRDALSQRVALGEGEQKVAERLNRIARPSVADPSPRSWSLPAMPPQVREALRFFEDRPEELRSFDRGIIRRDEHAAALVRWAQATAGGSRRSCVCGDRRDNDGVTHRTGGPCFQSPRSWSLPAPPPDDVTEALEWFGERGLSDSLNPRYLTFDALKHAATVVRWLLSVVEGEPPAPESEYAVSNWVRVPTTDGDTVTVGAPALDRRPHPESRWDTRTETWEPAPDPQAAESVCDRMGHDSRDVYEGGEFSHSVCDECGAEMLPDLDDEPQAAEPPRFERGFYRLARDLETLPAPMSTVISSGSLVAVMERSEANSDEWIVMFGNGIRRHTTAAALAAAGAVRVEEES